jgi:hypothetical protein
MSYAGLVDGQLRKAFIMLKDLAKDVTIAKKTIGAFNFVTGQAAVTTDNSVVTRIVITSKEKLSRDRKTVSMDIMLKSKDVGTISDCSTVTIDGVVWKFGAATKDSGFILLTSVYREV